ncbi:MAG: glycosyltransferase [Phycisphaerales bacterium]
MRPTYGVVTATLNARGTVLAAIRSAMSQCVQPAEYVVIDGGSNDGTPEVVEAEFAALREQGCRADLRLLRQSRGPGIAHAWNEAIDGLSADVVALVNGDDWLEDGAMRAALEAFHADPAADIVHGNARFHAADGRELGVLSPNWVGRLGVQCRTMHCSTFVRRRVYAEVGGFDPAYPISLDYDFIERCWRRGRRFTHLDRVLANFRLGGLSNTHRSRADAESLRIGLAHSRTKVLPLLAYATRRVLLRPAGIAGFELWLRDRPSDSMARTEVELKPSVETPRERVEA